MINLRTFSFYLSLVGSSYVDFGTYQNSAMRNPNDIQWIEMLDDFYWSAYNQAVAVGANHKNVAFGYTDVNYNQQENNQLYTIFDTGTSAINFSALYFDAFIE